MTNKIAENRADLGCFGLSQYFPFRLVCNSTGKSLGLGLSVTF